MKRKALHLGEEDADLDTTAEVDTRFAKKGKRECSLGGKDRRELPATTREPGHKTL